MKRNVYVITGPDGPGNGTTPTCCYNSAMRKELVAQDIQEKAFAALKKAVRQVVERHKKTGRSLAVWQNGKVVRISPDTIK